jgi:oligosaccharyl transferase (archaeosortase A-associated)
MSRNRISPVLIVAFLMLIIFGISLLFRLILPYHQAFSGDWIKFTSVDAYYHMRIVDGAAFNFPHLMHFDPYFQYPGGGHYTDINFQNWFLAGIVWLFSGGSPTQHMIDVAGVYFPAILAALTVIPAYFIGRTLFNRWVGLIAAALVAILPGEYLGRTILGLNDTPAVETLLSTTFICFCVLAIKSARDKALTFDAFLKPDWSKLRKPLIFSVLAGLFLAMYLASWTGALLFVFIFGVYLVIQFISDHLRGISTDYLGVVGGVIYLIALLLFFHFSPGGFYTWGVVLAFFLPVVMVAVSHFMAARGLKTYYYPIALLVIAGVAVGVFYATDHSLFHSLFTQFNIFAPSGAMAATTVEMQPFLAPLGEFSTQVAWGNFTTSFFLFPNVAIPGVALIALSILMYVFVRKGDTEKSLLRPVIWVLGILVVIIIMLVLSGNGQRYWAITLTALLLALLFLSSSDKKTWTLFLVWTLIMLVLTLGQRRFAYYLVVNIALLSAYLSWQIIWLAGGNKVGVKSELKAAPSSLPRSKVKKPVKPKRQRQTSPYFLFAVLVGLAMFLLVFLPNLLKARSMVAAEEAPYSPSNAWESSLTWMKDNTPDPFGDPDAYYRLYPPPVAGQTFQYPATAYGVTSWWDYGYWITYIAHRLPSANPGQSPTAIKNVAGLLLSDNETTAKEYLTKMDTRYVIIDDLMPSSKFWAMVTWAGQPQEKYSDVLYGQTQNGYQPVQVYFPDYYQTLVVRLFNFNGQAVTAVKPYVITWDNKQLDDGTPYKLLTDSSSFNSYQEAVDYLNGLEPGNHAIVGNNPFVSPVPLDAVPGFQLVHNSDEGTSHASVGMVPEVKIFEYTDRTKE